MVSVDVVTGAAVAVTVLGLAVGLGVFVTTSTELDVGATVGIGVLVAAGASVGVVVAWTTATPVIGTSVADLIMLASTRTPARVSPADKVFVVNDSEEEPATVGLKLMAAIVPLPVTPPESGVAATIKVILPFATTGLDMGFGRKLPRVTTGVEILVWS